MYKKLNIEQLKKNINSIDVELDMLYDRFNLISKNRAKNGLSRAIYNCIDKEAIQLQFTDKKMKELEDLQDKLIEKLREIKFLLHKEECKKAHKNFTNNKYLIRYLKYHNDKCNIVKETYTNDYKQYITTDMQYLNSLNANSIVILEYTNYNNIIDKTVNMPNLESIYSLGHVKTILLKPSDNIIYTCIPHQKGYKPYLEKWTDLKGNILQLIENGYTNTNKEVYTRIINLWGVESITIHNNFDSNKFLSITKYNNCKDTTIDCNSSVYYKKYATKNEIDIDVQELIQNTILKLFKNKDYKYNIDCIKNIMQ
ncbi:hypothetical protein [Clostridium botulinum]|uniref:hypothetical protein n=1 Tax=Clostridium botulinum TaxID=1491 RepID=UPI0017489F71|nr:hypothetical protein [Clostridium botulinum]MBD5589137.1 hypothetical protein [Clostridium botulinum]